MRVLIELLKSSAKLICKGTFLVFFGGFGLIPSVIAWSQIRLQILLACQHTATTPGIVILTLLLVSSQVVAAFLAALTTIGAAREPNQKKVQRYISVAPNASVVSAVGALFASGLGIFIFSQFTTVQAPSALVGLSCAISFLQAWAIVVAVQDRT